MASLEHLFVYLLLIFYTAAAGFYFGAHRPVLHKIAFGLAAAGLISNLLALICHIVLSKRLPFSNGYEFFLVFTFVTVFMYLLYEKLRADQSAGGIVMLINALLAAAMVIFMPAQIGQAEPLMPALKSPWLTVHVLTAIAAYSAFTFVAGLAIIQLKKNDTYQDDVLYKITSFGFAMLTLSIMLGAIWAEQVWGSYWTWDPKETWALLTWIIYAIYLHLHRQRGWRGKNACMLLIAGFVLVLFTFFGVNYLLPGLHSYA